MNVYPSGKESLAKGKLTGLYQGEAMSGKTHNLCTWPSPVIVCFDPDTQTARKMDGVTIIEVESFKEFEQKVVPHVKNRTLHELVNHPVETFGVDSISIASMYLAMEIQGSKERLAIQDFGTLLNKLTSVTMECTEAARFVEGKDSYHIIFTTHLQTIVGKDGGGIECVRPAIMGQFKDLLPRLFGFAFICEAGAEVTTSPGKPAVSRPSWQVRTFPPKTRIGEVPFYICGDRVGGTTYNTLPTTTDGTYPELLKAWGMKEEDGA